MMNRINSILIGLLWLLATTLGATFWFNTIYGFNIFSGPHWQHLAYMQATLQPVRTSFYVSIVVIVLIMLIGLYELIRPRFRRIVLPVFDRTAQRSEPTTAPIPTPADQANVNVVAPSQPTPLEPVSVPDPQTTRPPRLNVPTVTQTPRTPMVPLTPKPQPRINPETEYADIRAIFDDAGYVFKGMPKIKGVQTATVAIGSGEILWIGAVGVKTSDMQRAVQTLSDVFSDTLDDIEIHINAFIVAPADSTDGIDILQFATIDELRKYISQRPNIAPNADDIENFDAYSGYIGTVVDYIGKI